MAERRTPTAPTRARRPAGPGAGRPAPKRRTDRATADPERPAQRAAPAAARRTKPAAATPAPEPARPGARRVPSERVRRRRMLVKLALAALVLVGFLFVFVYPTRTFLQQRNQKHAAEHQLEVLRRQTKRLNEQTKKLKTDAEVERLARERFGLVRPGETPYVPIPTPPSTQPATNPTGPPSP